MTAPTDPLRRVRYRLLLRLSSSVHSISFTVAALCTLPEIYSLLFQGLAEILNQTLLPGAMIASSEISSSTKSHEGKE